MRGTSNNVEYNASTGKVTCTLNMSTSLIRQKYNTTRINLWLEYSTNGSSWTRAEGNTQFTTGIANYNITSISGWSSLTSQVGHISLYSKELYSGSCTCMIDVPWTEMTSGDTLYFRFSGTIGFNDPPTEYDGTSCMLEKV